MRCRSGSANTGPWTKSHVIVGAAQAGGEIGVTVRIS